MKIGAGVLMLASSPPTLAARSGYTRVAEHISGAELIEVPRVGDGNMMQKGVRVLANRLSVTSWYQFSSARLELRAWKRLRSGFRGLVHVLWADSDLGYMDLICRRRGVPICCTFHGAAEELPSVIPRPRRLRNLGAIIVVSKTQTEYFLSVGVPKERIVFIPHGVDAQYFTATDARTPADVFTVLSVGSYRRNFELLRTVCERFQDDTRFRFEIVSAPRFRAMFEGLPNVLFRSGISDRELVEAYGGASCLLMTAESSTANNAILEALACGLPIVTERVGGISEYVNAECALETAPREVEGLVEALKLLQRDENLRRKMAAAARRHAVSFSWENIGRLTNQVYQDLAAASNA
jgi:glycosyltransferase involved in cell wall biosynthesis